MSIPTDEKPPPRKFPAPCWGQDETLTLIQSYRDRWYALRRGYLRMADWDAVAAAIAVVSPAVPAKTSAQCRHKMEKLRQRYRAEKQRPVSSAWFFFESMDAMELGGSISAVGSNPGNQPNLNNSYSATVFHINSNRSFVEPNNSKMGFGLNPVNLGFRPKLSGKIEGNYKNPNLGLAYIEEGDDGGDVDEPGFGSGVQFRVPFEGKVVNLGLKAKKLVKIEGNYRNPNLGLGYLDEGDDVDEPSFGSGVQFRIPFEEKIVNMGLKTKKIGKTQGDYGTNCSANPYYVSGFSGELPSGLRMKGKRNMNPNVFYSDINSRENNSIRCEMNTDVPNGVPGFGYGLGKKRVKRDRGAIDEMVDSIKLLGEGFVKMEKMKMEMARDMEKTRMEMELKRNEMILESHKQIINAFMSAISDKNNKKSKKKETLPTTTVVPES